jgi:signal transduction histidine kinase
VTEHKHQADRQVSTSEEQVTFVADARLISVLGEQLIGSEKVGVLELVKNAYDAGASLCTVTLEGVPGLTPKSRHLTEFESLPGPIIVIRDDGVGMAHDDLIHGWLRPATARRARVKERLREERDAADRRGSRETYDALVAQLREAHGGRLPMGEKGIGRLATHRLGRFLWLRTKTRDDALEWELRIDWSKFDTIGDAPTDLDKVQLTLRHQPPTTDYGSRGSGTVICCYGGRAGYEWTSDQILDVGRAVTALRSPRNAPQGFEPRFVSPHVAAHELASPLERVPAPFELLAIVDENGIADIDFRFQPPPALDNQIEQFAHEEKRDLRGANLEYWKGAGTAIRAPQCGRFLLHVRAWLRVRNWLGPDYEQVTEYLDRFGGITIFRDGLSTLPAEQGAKVDWLDLTVSHIKKGSRISYYQLAGEIELEQEQTLGLRDRSSREGMIQTRAYQDLAKLARAVIDELQFQVQSVRDRVTKKSTPRFPLRTIRAYAKSAASVARSISEHYDFKKDPLKIAKELGGDAPAKRLSEAAESLLSLSETLKLQEEEHAGLMEAAGFGLAISVAVHELGKLAAAIVADVHQLHRSLGAKSSEEGTLKSLEQRADALLGEVKRLAPLRVTRSDSLRPLSVRAAVEAARSAFARTLEESQILLHIDRADFQIKGRFGAIAQVFANLIDNSIYWIGTGGKGGAIQFAIDTKERTILVSDTGPGISEKMSAHLFEPFYSEKSPPSGLGLYICRYYLGQCGARIRLARPSERSNLSGAQFLIDFSKSPTGES